MRIIFTLFLLGALSLRAQVTLHQSVLNATHSLFNPAAIAADSSKSIMIGFRKQWMGIEGTPQSGVASFQMPLKSNKLALAFQVNDQRYGVYSNTGLMCDGSVRIPIKTGHFSVGLRLGVEISNNDLSSAALASQDDPSFVGLNQTFVNPNQGFGFYYHHQKWEAGIALPSLLKMDIIQANGEAISQLTFQSKNASMMGFAKYKWEKGDHRIEPGAGAVRIQQLDLHIFGSLRYVWKNRAEAHVQYKSQQSWSAAFGYTFAQSYKVLFAYEYYQAPYALHGTGEVFLVWNLTSSKNKSVQ